MLCSPLAFVNTTISCLEEGKDDIDGLDNRLYLLKESTASLRKKFKTQIEPQSARQKAEEGPSAIQKVTDTYGNGGNLILFDLDA
jgi:hypothetical protein